MKKKEEEKKRWKTNLRIDSIVAGTDADVVHSTHIPHMVDMIYKQT